MEYFCRGKSKINEIEDATSKTVVVKMKDLRFTPTLVMLQSRVHEKEYQIQLKLKCFENDSLYPVET